jgi:putative transposase
VEVKRVGPRAPNRNAYAERWVQSIKCECLDHFIVFGEDHLRHLVSEYSTHYNGQRPRQGLGNRPLTGEPPAEGDGSVPLVVREERLGGLPRHYRRQAA